MKKPKLTQKHLIAAVIVIAGIAVGVKMHKTFLPSPSGLPKASQSIIPQTGCNQTLWDHIYHPQRLKVIEQCKTVSGTLVNFVVEKDGDFHGRLDVDDKTLINQDNNIGQHGYLVIEPICQVTPTQSDAIGPCTGYNGPKFDFNSLIGKHIKVMGSYVQDSEHNQGNGGWLEIHPVSKIEIIP